MILISLSPRSLTKCCLWLAACVGLSSVSCYAQSLFVAVESTPYDHQMARVSPVLMFSSRYSTNHLSLVTVNYWIAKLREIPYRYSSNWRTPTEVRSAPVADCKGKAVALYEQMKANGATNVRIVIGKHRFEDLRTHAWVEWATTDGKYVLDPTFNQVATKEDPYSFMYIPFYAFEGASKFRAVNATSVVQTLPPLPAVHLPPASGITLATSTNSLILKSTYEPHRQPDEFGRTGSDRHFVDRSGVIRRQKAARTRARYGSGGQRIPESQGRIQRRAE
jgi:predicted transglutaminase-like cysteine proteinase